MLFTKNPVKVLLLNLCVLMSFSSFAQAPVWAFRVGSPGYDEGRVCKVAPNGNIYLAGQFSGTIDLDPGPGVHNITSNGAEDIFLACYTSAGNFLWGFGIGGPLYDAAVTATVDDSSNVIIGGYIQSNVDFDPSPATTIVIYAGGAGTTSYGDGFVAKYSSSGAFQWAKGLGGNTVYDFVTHVEVDGAQNIYVCGEFTDIMTVSPTITWNSSTTGKAYIIKYDPSGSVIWARVFGQPGLALSDTYPHCMVIKGANIYICGVFQGSSFFNPNNQGGSTLIASGTYDAWFGRYDTAGNYVFAKPISGNAVLDEALYIDVDSQENLYIAGYTMSNTLTFDAAAPASSTVSAPGGGGNQDIFIAKYDSLGVYQWGQVLGGAGADVGWVLSVYKSRFYITGLFSTTVDFDASAAVANLTSNGNTDIYLCEYDLSGNYICGFRAGGINEDRGKGLDIDTFGNILTTGKFSGTNTDFDPNPAAAMNLSSNGLVDVYFAKYFWNNCGFISPCNLTASFTDSIVSCKTLLLTASVSNAQGGVSYNWDFGDGSTATGNPALHTYPTSGTYQITLIASDQLGCSDTILQTVSINVANTDFTISANPVCVGQPITFAATATGAQPLTYNWNFGDGSTNTGNPALHAYAAGGTYQIRLIVSDALGCSDTVIHSVTINEVKADFTMNRNPVCIGLPVTFAAMATGPQPLTYNWNFGDGSTATVSSPIHAYATAGTYVVRLIVSSSFCADTVEKTIYVNEHTVDSISVSICEDSGFLFGSQFIDSAGVYTAYYPTPSGCDSTVVLTVSILPSPTVGFNYTNDFNSPVKFTNTSVDADTFLWQFGDSSTSNEIHPIHHYKRSGTYTICLTGWTEDGCKSTTCRKLIIEIENVIDVPTGFSPNGDGVNDILYVRGAGVEQMSLKIYNRWGQMIFESKSLNEGWDGTYKGNPVDVESVAYILEATFVDGSTFQKQGNISIIR